MVRIMTIEDYEGVYALWKKIKGLNKFEPTIKLEYYRDLPDEDSTPGEAYKTMNETVTKPDDKCRGRKRRSHCRKYFVRSRRKTGVFVSCLCR